MTDSTLVIGLVLPDVMGTYGDGGNALILRQRARMRGYEAEVLPITLGDPVPATCDLYTLGGAEDNAQRLATRHLARYPGMQEAAERGAPILAICAAIQVLGHWYETSEGERVDGISLFDLTTTPQAKRSIGEIAGEPLVDGLTQPLTGFENHRGGSTLGPDAKPLQRVTRGTGNGADLAVDGVVQGSALGSYMHGPALARNPELADLLLARATGEEQKPLELPDVELLRRERLA
ncbi:glutamine amidotransferase [Tsukamurella sp. 8F]|uniref:type 1 glutamine amidotransferase n=1 Tax=unclassified Tsukamurella TaxID=2633480 RepID=UPI0023B9F9C4|nr:MULTISPECIES: glutamine amidotransferase [unclassified Tsukamurella]MDF0532070.1 glutamine amidotransferase [Tsukamurella sp. 8J]MDF0589182.1 glutamine amidotransferase [Tsukamurella sp. 8F]